MGKVSSGNQALHFPNLQHFMDGQGFGLKKIIVRNQFNALI